MKKIRYYIALWLSKLIIILLKVTKHKGTNFPGVIALKIAPDFLHYIGKPKQNIGVTGTNGKTTVANLVISMFDKNGVEVTHNSYGSNIQSGIITSLINNSNILGKSKNKIGVFEIDERSALRILPHIDLEYLIVTNLTRDSIMRNAHPAYISSILSKGIQPNTKLIINCDDMISVSLAPDNDRVYYGIGKIDGDLTESINLINDLQICPKCKNKLNYEYVRYHHIGKVICHNCDFKSPEADYFCSKVDFENKLIEIESKLETHTFPLINDSIFNIYNEVALIALFRELAYDVETLCSDLRSINIIGTRYNVTKVGKHNVISQMAKDKNAYACSRVFDDIAKKSGDKEIILAMNCLSDEKHWSENVCWLYDCDFELLNCESIKNIIITGARGKDYYLRALLAGIDKSRIEYLPENQLHIGLKLKNCEDIYILYGTDSIERSLKIKENVMKEIANRNGSL